jgi:hypothetical protein
VDGERSLPVAPSARALTPGTSSLPRLLLLLGLATASFELGSFFVKAPALRRGVTVGDLLEVAGAATVLLLYQAIARTAGAGPPGRGGSAERAAGPGWTRQLLALAGITYALGTGIHVAANSIHDMLDRTALGDPWGLADFWDEGAGHLLVDLARIAFAVGLTLLAARAPDGGRPDADAAISPPTGPGPPRERWNPSVAIGAAAYGFLYFAAAVEGQTVPIALPFCVLYLAWSATWRSPARGGPIPTFFRSAAWVSLGFLALWGVAHRGFPEFSRVGFGF